MLTSCLASHALGPRLVLKVGALLTGVQLSWLLGIAAQLYQAELWAAWVYGAVLTVAGLCAALAWHRRSAYGPWLAPLAAFLLALGLAGAQAEHRWSDALSTELEGQDLELTGIVASLPRRGALGLQFYFDIESAHQHGRKVVVPRHVSLGWYRGFHGDQPLTAEQSELRVGQAWKLRVRLRRPHGNVNPNGFDHELHLFEQGVRAVGYVKVSASAPALLLDPQAARPIDRLRQRVRDAIEQAVPDPRAAGVLAALSVGDQSAIDRDDWRIFRDTGVAHLMSISGLHVTMFAWIAAAIFHRCWRCSTRAMLWLPSPAVARWGGLLAAYGYAVFSGWGVPAQRTIMMLAAVTLLQTMGRRWPWPLVLLSAAVVVSAFDPWALMQAGFWLSFMAVGLLMMSGPVHAPVRHPLALTGARAAWRSVTRVLAGGLRSQAVATVGLAPLTLLCFQQISLVGFIANLVAIPLVTLLITPLSLLGVFGLGLWPLAASIEQGFVRWLQWLASWNQAVWSAGVAPGWAQAAGLLAACLLLMPLPWRLRWLAVPLVIPMLLPPTWATAHGQFDLLAVDVGQGTSVLVRTRKHLLVFDAGPQYSPESDAGERVLLPLLRSLGQGRIDRLVLSHRDTDHVGGALALIEGLPVTELLSSLEPGHPLLELPVSHQRCEQGQSWEWDGVHFEVLHPLAADHERRLKPNALSCVLKVSAPLGSALLTGDIERAQEARLVASGTDLKSDILFVPHHGSKTSSTVDFLEAVSPKVAIVQAGYRNRFGHPAAEVVARLQRREIMMQQTSTCGAWFWRGDSTTFEGHCQRKVVSKYWHRAP